MAKSKFRLTLFAIDNEVTDAGLAAIQGTIRRITKTVARVANTVVQAEAAKDAAKEIARPNAQFVERVGKIDRRLDEMLEGLSDLTNKVDALAQRRDR